MEDAYDAVSINDVKISTGYQQKKGQQLRSSGCVSSAQLFGRARKNGKKFHAFWEEEIAELVPKNIEKHSKNSKNTPWWMTTICWSKHPFIS